MGQNNDFYKITSPGSMNPCSESPTKRHTPQKVTPPRPRTTMAEIGNTRSSTKVLQSSATFTPANQ